MTAGEAQHQLRFEMACNHNCFPVGYSQQAIRAIANEQTSSSHH